MNYSIFNFQSKGENYKAAQNIFVRTLDIELVPDWSVGLSQRRTGYGSVTSPHSALLSRSRRLCGDCEKWTAVWMGGKEGIRRPGSSDLGDK